MRRSSSMDRSTLGPLRVRTEDNKPAASRNSMRGSVKKTRPSSGSRSLSGTRVSLPGNRVSYGGRPSTGAPRSASKFFGQKNRLSRGSGFGVRSNGVTRDPRPISDKGYQQKCLKNVLQFLTEYGYPYNVTPKILQSPTSKDFFRIFEFMMSTKFPQYKLSRKVEEEIPRVFKQIGYPMTISRSAMLAVGSPHTWPHILAALNFLVEWTTFTHNVADNCDNLLFPPDDSFEGVSEKQILFGYMETTYRSFLEGNDEYAEEDVMLRNAFSQKVFAGKNLDDLVEENTRLQLQLDTLEKAKDRSRSLKKKDEMLKQDYERLKDFCTELESHNRDMEQELLSIEENINGLEIEHESEKAQLLKMQKCYENQAFSQADVQRIHMKHDELRRQIKDVESMCKASDEDIWREEMGTSKIVEQVEQKCNAYNKLGVNLKLIPVTAENSSGVDYEIKKPSLRDGDWDFSTKVKPALQAVKSQCAESARKVESKKFALVEELETKTEYLSELQQDVKLLESKQKRTEDELEAKKQVFQTERSSCHEQVEEIQNELVQLNLQSHMSEEDADKEISRINLWKQQEKDTAHRQLREASNHFKEIISAFMEFEDNLDKNLKRSHEMAKSALLRMQEKVTKK